MNRATAAQIVANTTLQVVSAWSGPMYPVWIACLTSLGSMFHTLTNLTVMLLCCCCSNWWRIAWISMFSSSNLRFTDCLSPMLMLWWLMMTDDWCTRVSLVCWNVLSNPLLDGFFEDVSIPACFSLQGHFLFLLWHWPCNLRVEFYTLLQFSEVWRQHIPQSCSIVQESIFVTLIHWHC